MASNPTVTYFAISIFSSRTFWLNVATFLVAALSLTEVATLIPTQYVSLSVATVAMLNLWLRTFTVRPVAFIAPGATKAVTVDKLSPPAPPLITD